MTKKKVVIVALVIIMISGLFNTSYGVIRKSTEGDSRYNEMWEALEEYADGMSGTSKFNPATCDITYVKKWIEFFEIQDFTKDKLEVYRKECIKILGKLQSNLNVLGASDGKELLNRINKIDEYVIKTWNLKEDEIKTLNPELAKNNSDSLDKIDEKEGKEKPQKPTDQQTTEEHVIQGQDSKTTVDSIMEGAQGFLDTGTKATVKESELKSTSNFIYNILLGIAMIVAVIVGMIIGMQYMMASVEEKAKVKETLVPYVVGCFVVFSAFGIWRLVVNILSKW